MALPEPLGCHFLRGPTSVLNGTPVSAATLQPSLDQLYSNDELLKQVVDYHQIPSALFRCVEVNPAVQVGHPVYYDEGTGQYELAHLNHIVVGGRTLLAPSAEVWGIVARKTTSTAAVMLVEGIYGIDLTASTGQVTTVDKLYLSRTPGQLVIFPPDDSSPVPVLKGVSDGTLIFRAHSGDLHGQVLQWSHELAACAAGSVTDVDGHIVFSSADSASVGWLPASDPVFGGLAPPDAVFGYNLSQDAVLAAKWPPISADSTVLLQQSSNVSADMTEIPRGVGGKAVTDANGIWWLSDCTPDVPFVLDKSTTTTTACPVLRSPAVTIYASRPVIQYTIDPTLFLQSTSEHFSFLQRYSTATAQSGLLDFSFDSKSLAANDTDGSALVLKAPESGQITRGPAVVAINGLSPVVVSGTHQRSTGTPGFYGDTVVSGELLLLRELFPVTVAMRKATETKTVGALGVGLPAGRDSGFISQFLVPLDLQSPVTLSLRLWVAANFFSASAVDSTEQLSVAVRVLAQPNSSTSISTTSHSLVLPASPVTHQTAYEQISETFTAGAGDTVYVAVNRENNVAGYELQILKQFLYIERTGGVFTTTTYDPCACLPACCEYLASL